MRRFMDAAEAAAKDASIDALTPCASLPTPAPCAESFIRSVGSRALRRGISDQQVAELLEVYEVGAVEGPTAGMSLVVEALLQAPSFLYHVENKLPADGGTSLPLLPRELAARMSYYLWQSLPDQELLDAADAGALATGTQLREQAERMLQDPRALEALDDFSNNWLGLTTLEQLVRDSTLYPDYSASTARAMRAETLGFMRHVFNSPRPSLETLMTSSFSIVPDELLAIYGVTRPEGQPADALLELDAAERAGILTQASVLAAHAPSDHTSPVKRGVFLLNNLLCREIQLPVGLKIPELPPLDPNQTSRERFIQHEQPGCAGCHVPIDHLGFALQRYDSVGHYSPEHAGKPVDDSGALRIGSSADGDVRGGVELAQKLLSAPELRSCFARQWQRFALGRLETAEDTCSLAKLDDGLQRSDLDVRELVLDVVTQDSFRLRPAVPQ